MAEIRYQDLPTLLARLRAPGAAPDPVYLIYGEPLFVRHAFDDLLRALLPDGTASLGYEPIDGSAGVGDVVAAVGTYALLGGAKVVAYRDARIFHTRDDAAQLLESARGAHLEGDRPRAVRDFLAALAQMGCSPQDLKGGDRAERLPQGFEAGEDDAWLDALIEQCPANRGETPAAADACGLLEKALEAGLPPGHHLLITTDLVDRRRSLYALLGRVGTVVDCSVPKGERKADREAQQAVLSELMQALLRPHRKTMNPAAFLALCEMTGFEPGIFSNNLEILMAYTGERRDITAEDVGAALTRSRKDPLFELTNAVTDREMEASLRFLGSVLGGEIHALQALAALVNQVRKLLVAKDFMESPGGSAWQRGCPYPRFQQTVMPAIVQHDRELLARLEAWDGPAAEDEPAGRKKKKKAKVATDLLLAKNPANAYPIYQLLKKAERFSRDDLLRALAAVREADITLKSSALNPRLVLERVVRTLCGPGPGGAAGAGPGTPGPRRV
jgi:DNA polymerase-3 subunit delta